jgi:hypothetical protein
MTGHRLERGQTTQDERLRSIVSCYHDTLDSLPALWKDVTLLNYPTWLAALDIEPCR